MHQKLQGELGRGLGLALGLALGLRLGLGFGLGVRGVCGAVNWRWGAGG
ncbi:hypothetical protein ACWCXK_10320 [Streptomyces sp. NPDC001739]